MVLLWYSVQGGPPTHPPPPSAQWRTCRDSSRSSTPASLSSSGGIKKLLSNNCKVYPFRDAIFCFLLFTRCWNVGYWYWSNNLFADFFCRSLFFTVLFTRKLKFCLINWFAACCFQLTNLGLCSTWSVKALNYTVWLLDLQTLAPGFENFRTVPLPDYHSWALRH